MSGESETLDSDFLTPVTQNVTKIRMIMFCAENVYTDSGVKKFSTSFSIRLKLM